MTDQPTRVLLAAGFPPDYINDTIVPNLTSLGIEVVKVVPVDYKGEIPDVAAVLFMFQYTSHVNHDKFKGRAKAAGVKFILLERQSSGWPRAFKIANLDFPGYPIKPAPLPVAPPSKPPALIVANGAPLIPPPAHPKQEAHETVDDAPEPPALPFGDALEVERKALKLSQAAVGDLVGVSQSAVASWEAGGAVPEPCYLALVDSFPKLVSAQRPAWATRYNCLGKKYAAPANGHNGNGSAVHVGGVTVTTFPQRPDVEVRDARKAPTSPVAVLVPPVAHAARPLPLDGLRRAARALGITGPIAVIVDDGESRVTAGVYTWPGTGPDEAVESARADLDKRLKEKRAKMEAERIEMEAAINALGAA